MREDKDYDFIWLTYIEQGFHFTADSYELGGGTSHQVYKVYGQKNKINALARKGYRDVPCETRFWTVEPDLLHLCRIAKSAKIYRTTEMGPTESLIDWISHILCCGCIVVMSPVLLCRQTF